MGEIDAADRHRLLSIARDGLRAGGYEDRLIVGEWGFADIFAAAEPPRSVPLAAFGQEPPSYRTACWGVTLAADQEIQHLRALGAPQVLQLNTESVRRWKINATEPPELQDDLPPERLRDVFRERHDDWGPRTVLRLKGVALDLRPHQLDFYDAGLIPAIDGVVFEKLDHVLRNAIARARRVYSEHSDTPLDESQLTRLVFRLLAAKVFSDRGYGGAVLSLDPAEALAISSSLYGQSDALAPVLREPETQAIVWREIRKTFNLQNISVEALAHVYENTLVTKEHRRATGTHATPPSLAEYVVRKLPFESIEQEMRRVFEPFAGHAVFLIAAMGRLRELLLSEMTPEQRHDYFVQSLAGMERDLFALEVARLSLLLADYPNADSWNIQSGDVFTDPRAQQMIENASIILCNPPFGWFDPATRSQYAGIGIPNPAIEILNKVLTSPPALLGFILPWSFVDGQSFRDARRRLVEIYGQLDVIGLPDIVFKHSQVEPVLLLASERGKSPTRFLCSEVKKEHFVNFTRTWEPSWRTDTVIGSDKKAPVLWRHPLEHVWEQLDHLPRLDDIVSAIHRGIEYKPSTTEHLGDLVSDTPKPGFVAGLFNVKRGFEQYFAGQRVYLNLSSEVLDHLSHQNPWDEPKVIVSAARRSRGPWRISAVPDRGGLVCYQRFHGIWPQPGLPVEVLAAVLNGFVANAFVSAARGSKDVTKTRLKEIPVPNFSSSAADRIVRLVTEYRTLRSALMPDRSDSAIMERCAALLAEIDAEVLKAYALPPKLEQEVVKEFRGRTRPVLQSLRQEARSSGLTRIALPLDSVSIRTMAGSGDTWSRANGSTTIQRISTVLGQRLTAIIAGVNDREIEAWMLQEAVPPSEVVERMRAALEVVQLLLEQEAADTIQAWFVGKNRMLGDRAPAIVLSENPTAVLRAARAFAAYG